MRVGVGGAAALAAGAVAQQEVPWLLMPLRGLQGTLGAEGDALRRVLSRLPKAPLRGSLPLPCLGCSAG